MTQEEFIKGFNTFLHNKYSEYKNRKDYSVLPRDTGNLQDNGFKFKGNKRDKKWEFSVDDNIVPYADFINSKLWGKSWWDMKFLGTVRMDIMEYLQTLPGQKRGGRV